MEETTCLWVISKENFKLFPLDISEESLAEKIGKFREYHADRILRAVTEKNVQFILPLTLKPARQYARELYQLLIPQDSPCLPIQKPSTSFPPAPCTACPLTH